MPDEVRAAHSLGIQNSVEMFHALNDAVEDYLTDSALLARKAVSAAMFAWHLVDWVWYEYYNVKDITRREFQEAVKGICPSLSFLEDIANGTKHLSIADHTPAPTVKDTMHHKGAFSRGFSAGFDVSRFLVILADESALDFDSLLTQARDEWRSFFTDVLDIRA